ncbi:hypothetical protein CF319_g8134 [Tilletia indica]|nr:hypothetical protein CF319_g8134 [Tilletia indica]
MVITGVFHDPSSTDRQGKHRREKKGPDEGQQERHGYIEEFPRHPLLQLGLRILVAAVLQIYVKPHNLSTLLTMQPDEKAALARDPTMLEVKRPGLRSLSHEMKAFTRHELYLSGGLLSVNARFFVLIHLVEHRVENCHGERSTQPHTLIAMIASIFNSSDSIIGLNTAEMMNNLLGFIDRQVHYHTKDPLLESLVESVSSLGAYVFYADQIQNTSFSLHCTVRSERQSSIHAPRAQDSKDQASEEINHRYQCSLLPILYSFLRLPTSTLQDAGTRRHQQAFSEEGKLGPYYGCEGKEQVSSSTWTGAKD